MCTRADSSSLAHPQSTDVTTFQLLRCTRTHSLLLFAVVVVALLFIMLVYYDVSMRNRNFVDDTEWYLSL